MNVKNNLSNVSKDILERKTNSFYNLVIKRLFDILFSGVFIFILLPIILALSVIQIFSSGFPIFYRPQRGGYNEKPFRILKFRTMLKNADKIGGGTTALNDSRITKFGHFLRKTKLDELPQIFNVFIGHMSVIGPRPELLQYTKNYNDIEKYILHVRPGISDYSSIHFINLDEIVGTGNADEKYERNVLGRKNELRIKYVETISFKNDTLIFFETIFRVFNKAIKVITRRK